ncbi:efflux RND transporter periplasmic adaptor subunit [Croceimicrobium hydrocarbonivorans]|uniref:Efflux RND transporter periplasmic adaptor subunit n=1 Tax=Croceimicrobium hydrocarbonivorans TaxID=2761580 RepID=A0A7H0VJ37_9FLAO|nr:efflux RND transporter periplasmic adaptor subunit [Croceimicrobium hydrocarbonivorans]QNR25735.1 efflux RND transporter periplasmic adaptor subunit [Croceimicrobium hydrocarbonivorans]
MKKLSILFIFAILASCGQSPKDLAGLQASLKEKETALKGLQIEIDSIQAQIERLDTTHVVEASLTPVEVRTMANQTFRHFVRLSATVSSKENVLLSAEGNGRVVSVNAEEGDRVSKGQTILRLESDFIEGQLKEAEAAYQLAKTTFERRENLWKDSIGSEIEYLNAKTNFQAAENRVKQARAQYEHTFVKAPVNGSLDVIRVNKGEFVGAGTPVARVVDLSNLELETDISESYLKAVKVGDSVEVSIPALGLKQAEKVIFASQYINPENRSFTIKVGLKNNNALIKPNLLAEIKLKDYENPNALVLPSMAIRKDLKGDYVYLIDKSEAKPVARKRYVKIGRSFGEDAEIIEGLKAGEQVIVVGANSVNEGQEVEIQ